MLMPSCSGRRYPHVRSVPSHDNTLGQPCEEAARSASRRCRPADTARRDRLLVLPDRYHALVEDRDDRMSELEGTIDRKLKELGYELPPPPKPIANYVGVVVAGDLAFVSGHGPFEDGRPIYVGKVGGEMDLAAARRAAELVMLNALSSLRVAIGDLDRVRRVVKLLGMVNSAPDFVDQPAVIDAASDLLTRLFGDRGRHARSAVGMASLPLGIAVEIEMVVELERSTAHHLAPT